MIGKIVTTPKPITLAQVEEILSKRSGEGDFGYEQQKSFEYSKRFAKISARKAVELLEQLQEEFGVPHEVAVKIVDVIPKHHSQLRVLIGNAAVSEEKQKKILEMLSKVKVKHVEEAGEAKVEAPVEAATEGKKEEVGAGEKKAAKEEKAEASEKEEKKGKKEASEKEEKKEKKGKKEKE